MNRGEEHHADSLPPDEWSSGEEISEPRPPDDPDGAPARSRLDRALSGDVEAFAEIHEHYRPDLYAICLKRLKDPSLAEDAVQDTFLRAFTSLPNFDRNKPLWPWLVTIAFRACIDLQRRRSHTHLPDDIEETADNGENGNPETASALDAVIESEGREELMRLMQRLPKRQRRILMLYALDGWTCGEIAEAEGVSVGAVYLALFRARRKMRAARQSGNLGLLVLPPTWLRSRFQESADRIRLMLSIHSEGWAAACGQAVCFGALATMVVAAGQPAASLESDYQIRSAETIASPVQSGLPLTSSLRTTLPNGFTLAKSPVESRQPVADPASSLVYGAIINPNDNKIPENTQLKSLTPSPNYENDHTILASGSSGPLQVLFISHDGGASWKPLPSRGLFASTYMAIPPGYPQDRRIFSLGNDVGLQQSDDGGEIFRPVSPLLGWSLAISPSFGSGDSRILLGAGGTVFDYDAGMGVTRPALLSVPPARTYAPITFSPSYLTDPTVFVSSLDGAVLYRCKSSICDEFRFPFSGSLNLRLSPRFDQDGIAYATTFSGHLFVSNDGARTFQEIQIPLPDRASIFDLAVLWNKFSEPSIFVLVGHKVSGGVYRSLDGGGSWNSSRIYVPGHTTNKLIVTPTGRLLATGVLGGIGCSEDLGQTWAPRCTPEP